MTGPPAPRALPRTSGSVLVSVFYALGLCAGCSPLPASERPGDGFGLVVTQVPAADHAPGDRLSLNERYPAGSRIILVPAGGGVDDARILSGDLAAAGAPDLAPAADSIVFMGRRTADSAWAIFVVATRGSRPRQIVTLDRDCADPAHLAGDRLVFTCADGPEGRAADGAESFSLYVADRSTSEIERITFGPGSAFDPTPLQDGRILFSMSRKSVSGRREAANTALFTINPDGSLLEPFHGSHLAPAFRLRSRQTPDGGAIFVVADGAWSDARVETLDPRHPQAPGTPLRMVRPTGYEGTSGASVIAGAAEPLPDGGTVVAARPDGTTDEGVDGGWGIFLLPFGEQRLELLLDTPDWDEVEAIPLIPTPAPRGRPSALDHSLSTGMLLCYDALRSDGTVGPAPGAPRPAKVGVQTLRSSAVELGSAAIEADGSFFLEVPADVPIRVRTFDADGVEIATSGWFWVRPGEVRACFGCHESRETAPVNRYIEAIAAPPVQVGTTGGNEAR